MLTPQSGFKVSQIAHKEQSQIIAQVLLKIGKQLTG